MPIQERPDSAEPIEVPYGVLAATAPDAIITVDEMSCILSVNTAAERIFGWAASEMVGQTLDLIIPPEFRAGHARGMAHYLNTGEKRISWQGILVTAATRDGRRFPVEISFGEFVHKGRRIFSGFLRDVSERVAQRERLEETGRELEDALTALRVQVEEAEAARRAADAASEAKSQFVATMSHELRTPLNAIGGYVELLVTGLRGPITDQQREDLGRVKQAQARLLTLVNDVLNFARVETQRVSYDIRDLQVNPLLCSLTPLVEPQLRAKALEYECDAGDTAVTVCADQQKLEQILLNLLANAVKFTPHGGRIVVSTDADGDSVRMRVRDNGVGIPASRLDSIFDPFVQVDSSLTRVHGGTGLGLAISRELAHGMGGLITVESTIGQGTEFTVTLPAGGATPRIGATAGDLLTRDVRSVVQRLVRRLRAEPELPPVTDAELEDHTASLLADIAQLLVILDTGGAGDSSLVRDGAHIQELILKLHGEQRRRLGWTPALLEREFDALGEEVAVALRRRAVDDTDLSVEDLVSFVQVLISEAKAVGMRSLKGSA